MNLESKHNIIRSLSSITKSYENFEIDFKFSSEIEFERVVKDFIESHGLLGKDVFYVLDTIVDLEKLRKMKDGEKIDFGGESVLEKNIFQNDDLGEVMVEKVEMYT